MLEDLHGIYTAAPEMRALFAKIRRVAEADCTVLVRGETGSGKELVAKAIHTMSARRAASFEAINCATLSPTLLESELFGHVRGAFTGAVRDHEGLLRRADRGTLFLDEVADIPLDLQGRLLRVLEERTFFAVGGTRPVRVDVRVVSATNKALRREVAEGRFRDDLRYRLRVVPLFLPPLRDRTGDIEALLWHFIEVFHRRYKRRIDAISPAVMKLLTQYPWPGNVRELRSVVEHGFVMGDGPVFDVEDVTPEIRGEPPPGGAPGHTAEAAPGSQERQRLLAALATHGGRVTAAAASLGMSRWTLWRKLGAAGLRELARSSGHRARIEVL